jgi:transcriptional regulator NrdR family protein
MYGVNVETCNEVVDSIINLVNQDDLSGIHQVHRELYDAQNIKESHFVLILFKDRDMNAYMKFASLIKDTVDNQDIFRKILKNPNTEFWKKDLYALAKAKGNSLAL